MRSLITAFKKCRNKIFIVDMLHVVLYLLKHNQIVNNLSRVVEGKALRSHSNRLTRVSGANSCRKAQMRTCHEYIDS